MYHINNRQTDWSVCCRFKIILHLDYAFIMQLKDKIIHESLRLFSLKGFSSTTIDDILRAAGSSKGGFYNHFMNKEDLFSEVLKEARTIWRERNLAGLDQNRTPVANLKLFLEKLQGLLFKRF